MPEEKGPDLRTALLNAREAKAAISSSTLALTIVKLFKLDSDNGNAFLVLGWLDAPDPWPVDELITMLEQQEALARKYLVEEEGP